MAERIETNDRLKDSDLNAILNSSNFISLPETSQRQLISGLNESKDKEGGKMGKLFGINKNNAAMNIAFTLCALLVVVGLICMYAGKDYWDVIIPSITTVMGYIFGKGDK